MTRKDVINVKCPGCGEILEIDVQKERVTAHRKGHHLHADRKEGEDILDVAMRNVKSSKERIQNEFQAAQERLRNQSKHLDELFREAQKKVKETPPEDEDPAAR